MTPRRQIRQEFVRLEPDEGQLESGFLRGLIDGMRCGVLSIDEQGRLILLNEHAREILGVAEPLPPGIPLWQALPRHPQVVQALLGSYRMASLPNRAELALRDGSRSKTLGFTLSLVHGPGGDLRGAAMFFKDLTPIEHKAEQDRLKDRLAALGQMAASMAHEIRNPLAAIEVNCKLLKRRLGGDEECQRLLGKVTAEVTRLNGSVNSCLQYVRPVALNLELAELGPMLAEAVQVAEQRHGRSGIVVHQSTAPDIPPLLMDRTLLRQVFVNLVLNSLEAIGDSGTVSVEAERIDGPGAASIPYGPAAAIGDPWGDARHFAVVRVKDDGSGISAEAMDRIFNPFFTTKKQGSGVGLAVAKKIVGSHQGMIDVTSTPGDGAEIVVRLPITERAAEDMSQ